MKNWGLSLLLCMASLASAFDKSEYTYLRLDKVWREYVQPTNATNIYQAFGGSQMTQFLSNSAFVKAADNLPIAPIATPELAQVYGRWLDLKHYLAWHDDYLQNRFDTMNLKQGQMLEGRRMATLAELYILGLRLYFSEAVPAQRCSRVREAIYFWNQMGKNAPDHYQGLANNSEASSLFNASVSQALAMPEVVIAQLRRPTSCGIVGSVSRATEIKEVERLSEAAINKGLGRRLTSKADALKNADLDSMFASIQGAGENGIPTYGNALFELEKRSLEAEANFQLLKDDMFQVQSMVEQSKVQGEEGATPGSKIGATISKAFDREKGVTVVANGIARTRMVYEEHRRLFKDVIDVLITGSDKLCGRRKQICIDRCSEVANTTPTMTASCVSQCELNAPVELNSCQASCSGIKSLALKWDGADNIWDTFKPMDATNTTPANDSVINANRTTIQTDLSRCVQKIKDLVDSDQALSASELIQNSFAKDMEALLTNSGEDLLKVQPNPAP